MVITACFVVQSVALAGRSLRVAVKVLLPSTIIGSMSWTVTVAEVWPLAKETIWLTAV